ncbi:MAG: hypothetical protein MUF31_05380 [Akkermansiaceae bacterium]|jgi:hypothetical protein|nr:hypothetical protein [Akkermansiaceae bacterium]
MPSPEPFANPSDRIKALCEQALRKPDITVTERTLDVPKAFVAAPAPVQVAAVPVFQAAPEPAAPAPVAVVEQQHTEQDAELSAMLDERDQRLTRKRGRVKMVVNMMLLLFFVVPVAAVAVNPNLRAKFDTVVLRFNESVRDVKSMAHIKDSYDESLKKVAVRGNHIDEATRAMGVDPASVGKDEDVEMTAELSQLMGDEAAGFDTRREKLGKMGFIAEKLTGMESKDIETAAAADE